MLASRTCRSASPPRPPPNHTACFSGPPYARCSSAVLSGCVWHALASFVAGALLSMSGALCAAARALAPPPSRSCSCTALPCLHRAPAAQRPRCGGVRLRRALSKAHVRLLFLRRTLALHLARSGAGPCWPLLIMSWALCATALVPPRSSSQARSCSAPPRLHRALAAQRPRRGGRSTALSAFIGACLLVASPLHSCAASGTRERRSSPVRSTACFGPCAHSAAAAAAAVAPSIVLSAALITLRTCCLALPLRPPSDLAVRYCGRVCVRCCFAALSPFVWYVQSSFVTVQIGAAFTWRSPLVALVTAAWAA